MEVIINDNIFKVKPLLTPKDIQRGMMFRKFDGDFDGMLFFMDEGPQSFWMKNCLIPLDIVFVLKNKISRIHRNCEPAGQNELNPKRYTGIADHVIEFPAGVTSNFKEGDRVNMYLGTPQNPVR